jgi:hypothetical protein
MLMMSLTLPPQADPNHHHNTTHTVGDPMMFGPPLFDSSDGGSPLPGVHPLTSNGIISAVLMCLTAVWINAELYLAKHLVDMLTKENGVLLPDLHPHALFYQPKMPLHNCDLCSEKIKGPAYRCTTCDFDCCIKCFAKQERGATAEGVLRGDKGMKKEENVTNTSFVSRGLRLCGRHAKWLGLGHGALSSLSANTP